MATYLDQLLDFFNVFSNMYGRAPIDAVVCPHGFSQLLVDLSSQLTASQGTPQGGHTLHIRGVDVRANIHFGQNAVLLSDAGLIHVSRRTFIPPVSNLVPSAVAAQNALNPSAPSPLGSGMAAWLPSGHNVPTILNTIPSYSHQFAAMVYEHQHNTGSCPDEAYLATADWGRLYTEECAAGSTPTMLMPGVYRVMGVAVTEKTGQLVGYVEMKGVRGSTTHTFTRPTINSVSFVPGSPSGVITTAPGTSVAWGANTSHFLLPKEGTFQQPYEAECTCGSEAVGSPNHSSWCDKETNQNPAEGSDRS